MNTRLKKGIAGGILVVFAIAYAVVLFVLPPTQQGRVIALMALVIGSFVLYGGIKQHRATKGKGVSLPWWKSSLIIGALLQYCIAGLLITTQVMGEGISWGVPFALLTVGLSMYVLILLWQQSETNRTSKQPPTDSQQLPPIMQ